MSISPEDAVRYDVRDDVALLTIDFPPVNALGAPMREGLVRRLEQAQADPAVKAIVLVGANDRFVAGADIREFGKPKVGPDLHGIQQMLEDSAKPVVCAIDGHALGGGLELALAAPFRVAASRAKVGLPEVNLGLLPGAGGTQRLTRVAGPNVALDLILSGKHISAAKALELGLVDEVADGPVTDAAIAFARQKAQEGGPYPKLIERTDKVANVDPAIFDAVRQKNAKGWTGMVAPFKIVECIQAACTLSPREGLAFEKDAFQTCLEAPSRAAQVHLFFAERQSAKVDGISPDAKPKAIARVGVIGAGTMGGGIAMSCVNAGLPVVLLEAKQEALDAGLGKVKANYDISVKRGSRSQAQVDKAVGLITPTLDYADLADCDIVIEAVFEDMGIKREIFGKLDQVAKPGAILASNTSALSVDEIARATNRPGDVIGTHFFSPANVMKLCEVVRGDLASDVTIATAMNFAKQIGKVPVLAGNCEGFIGNRILRIYGTEADILLEAGATPPQVDNALKSFGFPMGLYLMRDMSGLDVGYRMRQARIAAGTEDRNSANYPHRLWDRIVEADRFGQKSGAGYYKYEGRDASPDPEIEAMLAEIAVEKGIERRAFTDDEIVDRILAAMVNEGAKILEEGIAQRASDIDVTYVYGYGFPKYRGGPMFWAQQRGLDKVLEIVRANHAAYGSRWKPARLLEQRATDKQDWDGKPVA
ncbi:3-hydroxyacyl-CoA dehydrogenase NAD-binding domain-containing protein [Sphingobium sp. JS3065]|uniref:3-hydroxyacyl-CoA dehydrogenase NAD-binding domain-containing protein n=1 Tax=Sphingobium sp. JS3065 TaxID=2970925 RepID=UPI0022644665|nr:3-hydroxyacyl-CoA dehydrogenase NAD-binding domain-containing protein [Sphingobium sp. JS3065]UZW57408.1 3-hydroxyacyl-CoA dehydrogenase NAD-binding domain-containing protein [Sphingobium sp. JS3065]